MNPVASTPWTCPTCKVTRDTAFCSTCGERPIKPRDLTLHGLLAMAYDAFSPVDGKVLRSFIRLLRHPGALTEAFQRGQRLPYLGPFQIFLLANVLFFATQSASTFRIFTETLAHRLVNQPWSDELRVLVDQRLAATGKTFAEYAPVFDQAVAVNAKSLIGLMVPPFALLLPFVFWRRHKPLAVQVVFSLHFYAFLLLLFCVPLVLMTVNTLLGGDPEMPLPVDQALSIILLLTVATYLYLAIGPVYGVRGPWRIVQTLILTAGVAWVFIVYRVLLLPITLYTT